MKRGLFAGLVPAASIAALAAYDRLQHRHTIWRNFPVIGHGRNLVELVGPEMRQYWFARDNEERPFNRDQRSWVYRAAKAENTYFGFGTDEELETTPNWLIVNQAAFPLPAPPADANRLPGAKILGGPRGRGPRPFDRRRSSTLRR